MSLWRLPAAADDRHTFFAHALALSAAHGPGPWPGDGYPLPDEEAHSLVSASALDSVNTNEQAAEMIGAMVRKPPEAQALQRLHDLLAEYSAVDFANHLTGRIKDLDRERVRNLGRWLAENGTRHSAVAAGIMLIGLTGDERDRELLLLLGSLDALTFYAMEALTRTQSDRDMAVFELAQRVWADGRVLIVSRLKETTDPRIKAWLLREGFRARYNVEYVAYIAATTGDLAGALAEADVDDALLDGASGILRALCNGMPGYEISDYADAPVAIERYLKLVRHKPSIPLINVVLTLDRCLDNDWCQEILSDPDWIAVVQQAIEGLDLAKFAEASCPAKKLGLRLHDHTKAWLEKYPYDQCLWSCLEDVDDAVVLAERLLPLDELQTSLASGNAAGVAHPAKGAFESVVRKVARHPGHGWPLLRMALASHVSVVSRTAVYALRSWPRDQLPADAPEVLRQAAEAEPNGKIREAMTKMVQVWAGSCSSLTQRA
jgi:hypothetical protein